ncbi:hypothetical protein THAOC_16290 [Thalassiosira oceanica]|uniref:Uncharacterized protein n=1 Tax=Thalassiosira oceanica TaxID=159749 RepID=K0SAA1_THAOC|nr:hypothetical protein THAOC_16290 [Thalassiosira oceanica]|eukprot:EJK63073.1 hypothetical protein THAOC_16290 [Thalassiosira oceanica]
MLFESQGPRLPVAAMCGDSNKMPPRGQKRACVLTHPSGTLLPARTRSLPCTQSAGENLQWRTSADSCPLRTFSIANETSARGGSDWETPSLRRSAGQVSIRPEVELGRRINGTSDTDQADEVAAATLTVLKGAKSDDNVNLGKHLKKIESIVSLKKPNTLTNDTNLGELSELERIKVFVKAERSPHLSQVKDAVENKRKFTKGVLKLFGTTTIDLSADGDEDDDSDEALQAFVDS